MSQQASNDNILLPEGAMLAGDIRWNWNPVVTEAACHLDKNRYISFHFTGHERDKSDDPMPNLWRRLWYWLLLGWRWERVK